MAMTVRLPIGDFSRMTYLSVKTLRHYHDLGLLVPVEVDPSSGYRLYDPAQVPTAQVIRRFRDLGMPLPEVKAVLSAPDPVARNQLIVAHLARMESQLEQTQAAVASLRSLLARPSGPITVEHRLVPAIRALAITEPVAMADIETWWDEAFDELHHALSLARLAQAGPDGALYSSDFFNDELGEVIAYTPIAAPIQPTGRLTLIDIPAAELAITLHHGRFSELDQTYGALGTIVAQREIGVAGPIREHYLITAADTADENQHRTEVCWPVFQTTKHPRHR